MKKEFEFFSKLQKKSWDENREVRTEKVLENLKKAKSGRAKWWKNLSDEDKDKYMQKIRDGRKI